MAADLQPAVRSLLHRPSLAIAAVLAIALGIGATTAVFSFAYAIVLRPLPYAEPDRLVAVWPARSLTQADLLHLPRRLVAHDYFRTLAIPLRHGRLFTADDAAGRAPVVIVNEATARRFWGSPAAAIGRRVQARAATDNGWQRSSASWATCAMRASTASHRSSCTVPTASRAPCRR